MEMNINSESAQVKTDAEVTDTNFINIPVAVREQISAKIAELKVKNNVKKVFAVIVEGDAEAGEKPYYICYMRRPNMMQFSQYMNFVQKDLVQANLMLAQNIFLDGDKELIDDEELFIYGTMQQLSRVIDIRNSDLVKK